MRNKPKGVNIMFIINTLVEIIIIIVCGFIQVLGAIIKGIAMFFNMLEECLGMAYSKLMGLTKKDKQKKQKAHTAVR